MDNCKIFKENITYVEYARSGVEYYTNSLEEYKKLKELGWKGNKYCDGFRIIPPEVSIVDLTDFIKARQYENLKFNFAYYLFLKKLLLNNRLNNFINQIIETKNMKYNNFEFLVSTGPVLEAEVRIAGSDNRIEKLKMDMADNFIKTDEYKSILETINKEQSFNRELESKIVKLEEKSERERKFYNNLQEHIDMISNKKVYNKKIFEIYNRQIIKENNIDVIIFLPFGCFKYLSSFANKNNIDKIMFWEIHAEKSKESTFKLYKKSLKDKNVLIIDNIYSGKTMKIAKRLVEEEGGKAITLGLNPKNRNNISNSEFVMILNNIYKSKDLKYNNDKFFEDIYIEILREAKNEKN